MQPIKILLSSLYFLYMYNSQNIVLFSKKESLRTGLEMRQAVKLPNGEDRNEWIAMNTIEQFNTLTMVYDIIADFCTPKSCPVMSAASPKGEYVHRCTLYTFSAYSPIRLLFVHIPLSL